MGTYIIVLTYESKRRRNLCATGGANDQPNVVQIVHNYRRTDRRYRLFRRSNAIGRRTQQAHQIGDAQIGEVVHLTVEYDASRFRCDFAAEAGQNK